LKKRTFFFTSSSIHPHRLSLGWSGNAEIAKAATSLNSLAPRAFIKRMRATELEQQVEVLVQAVGGLVRDPCRHGWMALAVRPNPPAILILSENWTRRFGLPGGLNGRQVADAARVARPKLQVLFVTGYAENAAVGNGHLDVGMHVIAKPFNMSEFSGKVREMVDS
jgi:hypothetical protein